jgi:predicted DsbA family dithiol-disulfide isomerase
VQGVVAVEGQARLEAAGRHGAGLVTVVRKRWRAFLVRAAAKQEGEDVRKLAKAKFTLEKTAIVPSKFMNKPLHQQKYIEFK